MDIGADYIATGHYARIIKLPNGRYSLKTSATQAKDQTYALYNLTQEQLAHTLMPVGEYSKEEIRELAEKIHLRVANKPDSQDICFVPDGDYAGFIERSLEETLPTGNFVTLDGKILGQHKGITHYTVGQRKGLGLALGYPAFVIEIRPETNEVVLSAGEDLFYSTVFCSNPNWISIDPPAGTLEAEARFRHSKQSIPVTVEQTAQGLTVSAKTPVRAPTPGQLAVFYHEDLVLGSAWIDGATP